MAKTKKKSRSLAMEDEQGRQGHEAEGAHAS